jgi:hypothetical protein
MIMDMSVLVMPPPSPFLLLLLLVVPSSSSILALLDHDQYHLPLRCPYSVVASSTRHFPRA